MTRTGSAGLTPPLIDWYRARSRDVPWREERDPYRIWVSEVMAQQTRISVVRERIHDFLSAFPDIAALAAADLDDVLKAWEGLGYYARARNLHRAAQVVVSRHEGRIPRDPTMLRELPGVGPYTAGALGSLAFGIPEPAVDGNVRRVLSRLLDLERPAASALDREMRAILEDAEAEPGEVNQAFMDLGAAVCTPRRPDCDRCPLRSRCMARRRGTQEDRPARKAPRVIPHHAIAVAAVRRDDRVLIGRRPPDGLLGGLWEFPGGKVEPGETPEQAAEREIEEEMCLRISIGDLIAVVPHAYSHFRITLHAFDADWIDGEPCGRTVTEWRWVRPRDLASYAFPAANRPILERLSP